MFVICFGVDIYADPGRWEQTISGDEWELWLDKDAEWIEDELFVKPPDISRLPMNPPSCGWDSFDKIIKKTVEVPGTVEQYYWSENGNPVGRAGDYRGVSWWSKSFHAGQSLKGKKILIAFESVNLRAEVFVNHRLVGYDIIGNTSFEADITDAVVFDSENRLDVRITDPGGNFTWPAHIVFPWGRNLVPIVRGFGGITGEVKLLAVDSIRVEDIFVENTPKIKEANIHITLSNTADKEIPGTLTLTVHEYGNPENVLWEKTSRETISASGFEKSVTVNASRAKVWDILKPNLYTASVTFSSSDDSVRDTMNRRFGFRWFDIGEKNGDQRLYLNGRRIFMMANVHRGYWATNGIFPTHDMVKKDVEIAIKMGFNSIAYHNAIGHQLLVRYADEYGLLATGESAGYRINDRSGKPVQDKLTQDWRREKLFRFVKSDRSYPSIIAYMLKNEDGNAPDDDDMANIAHVRGMDPTRILLYTGDCDRARREFAGLDKNPLKLFYKPNDPNEYWYGWFDKHHWNRYPGYMDDWCYRNPGNYMRLNSVDGDSTTTVKEDEIIFYGEEGAFGTTLTLGRIREQLYSQGSSDGWRENEHIDWFNEYDRFLDETGFRTSFPTVDNLTTALGANMHYFHGRIVENARMSNVIDAYNLNGWSAAGTHTDLVDAYRNPTGDPSILAYYNQPLYVAVKIRDKVIPAGTEPVADIFLVNETGLKGRHSLELDFTDPVGNTVFSNAYTVTINGGEEYGQLLVEEVRLPATVKHGYYTLNARITRNGNEQCTGFDTLFAVDYTSGPGINGKIAVVDTSGTIQTFLKETYGISALEFTTWNSYSGPQMDYIVVGAHNFNNVQRTIYSPIMEQVINGATLIVIDNTDRWADQWDRIHEYQAIQYTGTMSFGGNGRFFVGKSPLLNGLPQSQSMNWEYQIFYRSGLRGLDMGRIGNETVVALASQSRKDIVTAVARIPFGRGQIIASTLDILPYLDSNMPQSATAKRLFLNFLEYAHWNQ
ncbi:sugar-binding domain-containing protein [Candidatus Latescibacterota bacterium]